MPLSRKTKMALRMSTVIITAVATSTVSIIGALVGMNGGDFWPWVWAMCALYAIELIYLSIDAIASTRSPEHRRRQTLHRRRKAARLSS